MRLTATIWVGLLAVCLGFGVARAANFTASLDRDTMTLGETATLSLTFEGGSPQNAPAPEVPGLDITSSGNSQSFSLVNGAMSSTVTVSYSVTARRAGRFTIPAFNAEVAGQMLATQPISLTVLPPDAPTASDIHSGNEAAFMTLGIPPGRVYVGEELTAELRIYIRQDVQNFANFQFNSQAADGLLLGKSVQGGRSRARVGGQIYTVIPLTYALTATKTGRLQLGPFAATATIVLPGADQSGGDPFFRQFFNQGQQQQISLATDTASVDCLPLPAAGKPAGFNGAIGNFTLNLSVGPTNISAGDPVTVRIQISGHGALDSISLPDQSTLPGFKVFPPTVKTAPANALALDGAKTFEEIVTPQSDGVHAWPAFDFSFFNPDDGQYHTVSEPAVALTVHSAGASVLPVEAKNSTPGNTPAPADISPVKQSPGVLRPESAPWLARPGFLVWQSLPVLALLAAWGRRRSLDRLANNPRRRRQLAAARLIGQGLIELRQAADANQPDAYFAMLFRLLQEQLGAELDCPASAITENIIEEHPRLQRAPQATREALRDLFQHCNQARYAPVRGTSELNSVTARFEQVRADMQTWQP